jgi:NAD(P)H-dependent flavin oxidoreductase YrpB (nitropropane dioxygenase family)
LGAVVITARLALIAWAVIGPLIAGGIMWGREKVMVAGAVANERNAGIVACNARVAEITRAHDEAIDASVDEAIAAADTIGPTPGEMVALQKLCDASLGCRSRRTR